MKTENRFYLMFISLFVFICLNHILIGNELETYYPSDINKTSELSHPIFIFRSSDQCTLKIIEMNQYLSESEIYNTFPVYEENVDGKSFLIPDFTFSEGILYAWYLSGYEKHLGSSIPVRSEIKFFKLSEITYQHSLNYRKHLIEKIFEESVEFRNSIMEGYKITGSVKINGTQASDNELLSLLNKIRSSKRNAKRVRVK